MTIKVRAAWLHQPACINAVNMTTIYAETGTPPKPTLYEMEWLPQGLLVRVRGVKRAFIVGHANIRSAELYEDPTAALPSGGAGTYVPPPEAVAAQPEQAEPAKGRKKTT